MILRRKFYPWASALPKKLSINCATLFGLGNFSAPGTWGSAAGILLYCMLFEGLGFFRYVLFAALLAYLAIGLCDAAERHLQMRDPGKIILDEFVAIPFCFLPIAQDSFGGIWLLFGFALFRFFDIKKPFWIKDMQNLEGGVGCVVDDIVAALATTLILNLVAIIS